MRKIKLMVIPVLAFMVLATPVKAFENKVQIQQLPTYMNTDTFKISCSAVTANLVDTDASTTTKAQFYFTKEGGGETAFGSLIDLSVTPCQAQLTGSQINDEKKYTITVKLDSGEISSTTFIFDRSGPSPVSGFSRDGLSDGARLKWTNPENEDFDKVIIYRGEEQGFSADSSHEIAVVRGSANSPMAYEDHSTPPSGKNYYYLIRALDKAGNTSGLVGDGGGVTVVISPTPGTGETGKVTVFPKEAPKGGSVLGTEATPSPTPTATVSPNVVQKINNFASTTPQPFRWILTHKKISLGVVVLIGLSIYTIKRIRAKKK